MDRAWIYYTLGGLIIAACGAYIIGNWWVTCGVFCMMWGNNVCNAAERRRQRRPRITKDWIGNQRGLEG